MAYLVRLIGLVLLVLTGSNAFALVPTETRWRAQTFNSTYTAFGSTEAAAVSASGALVAGTPGFGSLVSCMKQPSGTWQCSYSNSNVMNFQVTQVANACPANSTSVSGGCQCNAPDYVEDPTHTQCVPVGSELEQFCQQHAAAKHTFKMSGSVARSAGLPGTSCYVPDPPFGGSDAGKGCDAVISYPVGVPSDDGTKLNWAGTGSFEGSTCTADDESPTPPSKDDPCPGGFQGTVNGEARCVPAEPDKGIEGVRQTSATDADGTKRDTTETTKCEGDKCTTTTTTTTTTSTGTVSSSTTSSTGSAADTCKTNPSNPICQRTQGGRGAGVSQSSCQENPSAQGCGGEGAGIGDLYAKKDKTIAQVMKKASDDLKAAPLGSAVGGFFTVGSGGSCPSPSGVVPFLNKAVTFDMFCTNFAAQMFLIVRMVLLMLATWMAFRVAIDH